MENKKRLTKKEKIFINIKNNKSLIRKIDSNNFYSIDYFYDDCINYIQDTKKEKILSICTNYNKSSGSSKRKIFTQKKGKNNYYHIVYYSRLYNYISGLRINRDLELMLPFMNMNVVFAIHYNLIHSLFRLGFINKKQCEVLAQKQPRDI